jgi:hypothetical protein
VVVRVCYEQAQRHATAVAREASNALWVPEAKYRCGQRRQVAWHRSQEIRDAMLGRHEATPSEKCDDVPVL